MDSTITLRGATINVAQLDALQVATWSDAAAAADNNGETKVQTITRSLLVIAQALANAKSPIVQGLTDDAELVAAVNAAADYVDVTPAFLKVLQITGLIVEKPGEAQAEGSTSSEPSAALPATPDGPSIT